MPHVPEQKERERTFEWVHSNVDTHAQDYTNSDTYKKQLPKPQNSYAEPPRNLEPTQKCKKQAMPAFVPNAANITDQSVNIIGQKARQAPLVTSTPAKDISGPQLIETSVNQQVVSGLARQNLPKCHPDTFSGNATLFHPWKNSFKAMNEDANVSATQQINYLRSFTSGEPQRLVDNYRKRQQSDPIKLLENVWSELEHRFESAAVVTNTLLDRLKKNANFGESDNASLQKFADLCADVESQTASLPGLACLNFCSYSLLSRTHY